MLWLERRVVDALTATQDPRQRGAVAEFVEGSLRSMPTHLRIGVTGESLLLGAWVRLGGRRAGTDREALAATVARWETNPIGVIRQYARLLASLVLFAEQELAPAA